MHSFCRSTTLAILPSEEDLDKAFGDFKADNIPEGMDFDEWLDGLEPTEDGKLVFRDKGSKATVSESKSDIEVVKGNPLGNSEKYLSYPGGKRVDKRRKSSIISRENITKVPFTKLSTFSELECKAIRRINRKLLRFVKNKPVGTEAIAYYGENLRYIDSYFGKTGEVNAKKGIKERHYIVHNHPNNRTFTPDDLLRFVEDTSATALCAQGNNGKNQYFVEKLENYQEIRFYMACIDVDKEVCSIANDISLDYNGKIAKAESIMKTFLEGVEEYGVGYIEGKNR